MSAGLLALLAGCAGPAIAWPGVGRAEDPEPVGDRELREYKEAHYRALGSRFVAALAEDEVVDRLARRRVVFLGDHHRDRALHARHLALIERLAQRPLALALEAIGTDDEPLVRRYLDGHIELDALRAAMRARWPESWLDHEDVDGGHYRELLALARRTGSPVVALEPTPRPELAQRDAGMAAAIERALAGVARDRLLVVVVGHTHLLGPGGLASRIAESSAVVGARASNTLRERAAEGAWPAEHYLRSDRDVLFPPEAL